MRKIAKGIICKEVEITYLVVLEVVQVNVDDKHYNIGTAATNTNENEIVSLMKKGVRPCT